MTRRNFQVGLGIKPVHQVRCLSRSVLTFLGQISKKVVDFRHLCTSSMCKAGHCLPDATQPTLLYNDNDACVKWSHNMTSKAACQIEIRENSVREWVQDKSLAVKHVAGNINPSDIFTKEMRDGTHFRRLRDSFMSRYQALGRGNGDFLPPNPSSLEPCL